MLGRDHDVVQRHRLVRSHAALRGLAVTLTLTQTQVERGDVAHLLGWLGRDVLIFWLFLLTCIVWRFGS